MRRWIVFGLALALLGACQKRHPVKVSVIPQWADRRPKSVAILPFASRLNQADDPDREAPKLAERLFLELLDKRQDYRFLSPSTVRFAIERDGLQADLENFQRQWEDGKPADPTFLRKLGRVLQCDAVLIGTVDSWQKDEADYQENTTPVTYVGMSLTMLDIETGETLYEAVDENYLEAPRTETDSRKIIQKLGIVHRDSGADVYKAPDFEDVARIVVEALVSSLPPGR
jgi:hypothetical protein